MSGLETALRWLVAPAPEASCDDAPPPTAPATAGAPIGEAVVSAAVLGRPGEAEPVAAALALSLRRLARARSATVLVVGGTSAEPGAGGNAAARRAASALTAHGVDATARGRLVWASLPVPEAQAVAAARRAELVAPPLVLALTVPRTAAWDVLLTDLGVAVLVSPDPDGSLARLAAETLPAATVHVVRPLSRGPARTLARAGLWPARALGSVLVPEAA